MGKSLRKPGGDGRRNNGGGGRGGGKKPGAVTRLTRARVNEIAEANKGEMPIDVMFDNMLFWHRTSKALGDSISEAGRALSGKPELAEEFVKMLRQFLNARENAQRCAVDCAPYFHARLATVEFKGDVNVNHTKVLKSMTPQQAAEAYASSLKKEPA